MWPIGTKAKKPSLGFEIKKCWAGLVLNEQEQLWMNCSFSYIYIYIYIYRVAKLLKT